MRDLETQARAWRAALEALTAYLLECGVHQDKAVDMANELMNQADDTITIELPHTHPEAMA